MTFLDPAITEVADRQLAAAAQVANAVIDGIIALRPDGEGAHQRALLEEFCEVVERLRGRTHLELSEADRVVLGMALGIVQVFEGELI